VVSFQLSLQVLEYQTAILREDYEAAEGILPKIPENQKNKIARFLEAQSNQFSSSPYPLSYSDWFL